MDVNNLYKLGSNVEKVIRSYGRLLNRAKDWGFTGEIDELPDFLQDIYDRSKKPRDVSVYEDFFLKVRARYPYYESQKVEPEEFIDKMLDEIDLFQGLMRHVRSL